MQELMAEQPKNWLQLYVDAMTEKNPYKRLALVRQLRQIPRHDESDDSQSRPGLHLVTNHRPAPAKPPVQASRIQNPKPAEKSRGHLVRTQKAKHSAKVSRRGARLRSA